MRKMIRLIVKDMLGGIPEPPSRKDILCSDEFQYLARQAQEFELRNQQLEPTLDVLKAHLGSFYESWEGTDAEKLRKHLDDRNNLILLEEKKAREAREESKRRIKEAETRANSATRNAEYKVKEVQKQMRDLREGTVPIEVLEEMMQRIPAATLTVDPNFLVIAYSPEVERYAHHIEPRRNMDCQRIFSTAEGFEDFKSQVSRLEKGQALETITVLGKEEDRGNYVSTVYPIHSDGRLVAYGISVRPETKIEMLKRKSRLLGTFFSKETETEIEPETDVLPEPGKA